MNYTLMPEVGFHFLQWASSLHDKDWHNMPQEDRIIVLQRLAALEQTLLAKLVQTTRQKFERLVQLRDEPLSDGDIPALLTEVEEILTGTDERTVADRLACLLSPNEPAQEIVGGDKMLARLRRVMAGLEQVKDRGFKVTVLDRQRQPLRLNLIPVGGSQARFRPAYLRLNIISPCGTTGLSGALPVTRWCGIDAVRWRFVV